jgi:hypothetical protein
MGAIQRPFLQPSDSPGPRYLYVDTTMRATPSYSLGSRNAIPPPPARSPGPCYNPSAALIGNVTQPRAVRSHPPTPVPPRSASIETCGRWHPALSSVASVCARACVSAGADPGFLHACAAPA